MSKTKIVLIIVAVIVLFLALDYSSLLWYSFIGPKREAVRRKVFKETRSYNEAKLQDLSKYRLEYLRAETEEEKETIASTIRHMYAEYDESKLPSELKSFLHKIKYQ